MPISLSEDIQLIYPPRTWEQSYAQKAHSDALQHYGEQCLVMSTWHVEDFDAGLVARCYACFGDGVNNTNSAALNQRLANVYEQSGDSQCLSCGGGAFGPPPFKAGPFVDYMIASDITEMRQKSKTGDQILEAPQTEFLWTPRLYDGDLIIRVESWATDGTTPSTLGQRYILSNVNYTTLRTGLALSNNDNFIVSQSGTLHPIPPEHVYYSISLNLDAGIVPPLPTNI